MVLPDIRPFLQNLRPFLQHIRPFLQSLPPSAVLGALGFGVVILCFSLIQIFRRSVRNAKPRPSDEDRIRELLISTRASLLELQCILASEAPLASVAECLVPSAQPAPALPGRGEVEFLQKVSKYRIAAAGVQPEAAKIH